jgi:hypothetical protein
VQNKSKIEAELDFLSALEHGRVMTQVTMSRRIAVSVGLINALLKRAMRKGYVKAAAAPYKRYAYYLTPKGFSEKSRLVADYLEVSLDFFRKARQEYLALFMWARARGVRRVALAGSGELVEIAMSAIREAEIDAVHVFDPDVAARYVCGLPVANALVDLPEVEAIVVAESRSPQLMFDHLVEYFPDAKILAPKLLRITRQRLDFRPKVSES